MDREGGRQKVSAVFSMRQNPFQMKYPICENTSFGPGVIQGRNFTDHLPNDGCRSETRKKKTPQPTPFPTPRPTLGCSMFLVILHRTRPYCSLPAEACARARPSYRSQARPVERNTCVLQAAQQIWADSEL